MITSMITSRIDEVTRIPEDFHRVDPPAPRSVKIELTANCNYRCAFCVKSLRPDNGEMDRAMFSRLIREIREAGVEELGVFYIGESFTCKWLPAAIAEAKAVGFPYIFLTTNGSIATPAKVEACMKAGLDSLKFSINFSDFDQFKAVARVKPALYRKALDNLKAARRIRDAGGYKCGLYASSIAFDGEQGAKMKALIDEHVRPVVDEFYWLPLFDMGGAARADGKVPTVGNPGRLGNMRRPLPCWAVVREGHVTKDGLLAACCFGSGIDGDLIMADLKEVGFMTGWNSDKFQQLRIAHFARDVRGTACEECIAG